MVAARQLIEPLPVRGRLPQRQPLPQQRPEQQQAHGRKAKPVTEAVGVFRQHRKYPGKEGAIIAGSATVQAT